MKRKILLSILFTLTLATTWLVYSLSAQTIDPVRKTDPPVCQIQGSIISGTIDLTLTGDCAGVDLGAMIAPILSPPILTSDEIREIPESSPQAPTLLTLLDDEPAPTPELQGVENAFGPLWEEIKTQQEGFYELYGRYWQGLTIGPGIVPTYPNDQAVTWGDMLGYTPTPTYTLRIDTYNGPAGPGYVAALLYDGWEAAINYGIEDRGYEWRPIYEEEPLQ